MAALRQHLEASEQQYDWVFVGDDPLLYALASRRDEAWVKQVLPCPLAGKYLDFMVSKLSFLEQTRDAGLAIPAFCTCTNHAELVRAGETLGYPLVIKQTQGFGGMGVAIIEDDSALMGFPLVEPVIAQAFVEGRLCSAAAVYANGRLLAYFSYYRSRTWGPRGPSTAIQFQVFPALESHMISLGHLSHFSGLCGTDFIERAEDGQLVVLEQNFRPTLTMLLGERVGVDLGQAVLRQLTGGPDFGLVRQFQDVHGELPLFPIDLLRAADDRDLGGVLRWILYPTWWRELNWRDMSLLGFNLRYVFGFYTGKLMAGLRR